MHKSPEPSLDCVCGVLPPTPSSEAPDHLSLLSLPPQCLCSLLGLLLPHFLTLSHADLPSLLWHMPTMLLTMAPAPSSSWDHMARLLSMSARLIDFSTTCPESHPLPVNQSCFSLILPSQQTTFPHVAGSLGYTPCIDPWLYPRVLPPTQLWPPNTHSGSTLFHLVSPVRLHISQYVYLFPLRSSVIPFLKDPWCSSPVLIKKSLLIRSPLSWFYDQIQTHCHDVLVWSKQMLLGPHHIAHSHPFCIQATLQAGGSLVHLRAIYCDLFTYMRLCSGIWRQI